MIRWPSPLIAATALFMFGVSHANAENLFSDPARAHVAGDQRAGRVGDLVTIVVYQNAEARNAAQNASRQRRNFEGGFEAGEANESASLSLDGSYSGQGEVRRSESFVTQISAQIVEVLANGDLKIEGAQTLRINGETTEVAVRGRVRATDIDSDNRVLSTRIADAEISYDGRGFVSRNARPNVVHRIFSLLGLGG